MRLGPFRVTCPPQTCFTAQDACTRKPLLLPAVPSSDRCNHREAEGNQKWRPASVLFHWPKKECDQNDFRSGDFAYFENWWTTVSASGIDSRYLGCSSLSLYARRLGFGKQRTKGSKLDSGKDFTCTRRHGGKDEPPMLVKPFNITPRL